jgi:hypothetical protein
MSLRFAAVRHGSAASIVLRLAIVPGDLVSTTFLEYVPTYSSILLSIY